MSNVEHKRTKKQNIEELVRKDIFVSLYFIS